LDGAFRLGFVGSPPRNEDGYTRDQKSYAKDPRHRISFMLYRRCRRLTRASKSFWWTKIEHGLKAQQDGPENSQGNTVKPAELHANSGDTWFGIRKLRMRAPMDPSFRRWQISLGKNAAGA
jgi:hypothetical protein